MQEAIAKLVEIVGGGLVKGVAALIEGKSIDEATAVVIEHLAAQRAQQGKFPDFDPR
jgi:F0F1-type ATP synthase membrane subunit c/vacuolar-type H+-ATPase subunit K